MTTELDHDHPGSITSHDAHHQAITVTHLTDAICVIEVADELDLRTAPTLQQLIAHELAAAPTALLIDLSGCEFIGSSAIAVLIAAHDHTASTSTHLALSGMHPIVSRALQVTGLDTLFNIYPATGSAVAALHTR